MNPLVLNSLIRAVWRHRWPFLFGVVPGVVVVWLVFPAWLASLVFAVAFVVVVLLVAVRTVLSVMSGWNERG